MDPGAYLRGKGLKLRQAPGQWQLQCPFCGDKNKYGHLYVNREHGAWMCQRCQEKGSFYDLQKRLGDTPQPGSKQHATKTEVWRTLVGIAQDALVDQPDALRYLREKRGLRPQTIGKYRLGWVPRNVMDLLLKHHSMSEIREAGLLGEGNYPLFYDMLLIPYYDGETVTAVRAKDIGGGGLRQAKDSVIRLFGVDNLRGHKEVFICEGELDAMFLDQMGYSACAIPGAASFQDRWVSYFDDAHRIFVVLDADDAGRKGAHKIAQVVGRRARIISLPVPEHHNSADVTEFFLRDHHTKDEFDEMVDALRGKRLFTLADGIEEREKTLSLEGLKLGWRDLDSYIEPGLLPGQVAVVLAKTGAGKTAFLTQAIHNLSSWESYDKTESGPGIPVLMLSLEQTKSEIAERLMRVARLHNPWVEPDELRMWHSKFRMNDDNRVPAADVPLLIDEYIDEIGEPPRILIVDYLGYWSRSFAGKSKYEQTSEAIMELKRLAKDLGVAVITPHQVSRLQKRGTRLDMDFARDSGVVEETADFMLGLYRPHEEPEEGDWNQSADVRLELLKSRHGSVGRQVHMLWAPYSLALAARGGVIERRISHEWNLSFMQAPYPHVLEVHQGKRFINMNVMHSGGMNVPVVPAQAS